MKTNFTTTAYLLILVSLGYIATDIYLPSLPALSEYFKASDATTQLTLLSYLISFSFTPLIFGPLSDMIGRKKTINLGLAISLVATAGCYLSPSLSWLISFRFFQGIGTGAVLISSRAMASDIYSGHELAKQISRITMLMPLALSLAPTLGGYLQNAYGWRAVFLFMAAYISLIIALYQLYPESLTSKTHRSARQLWSNYKEVTSNKLFLLFGLGLIIPTIGMFAYMTVTPFLFQEVIGLNPAEYGRLALYIGGAIMVSSYCNTRLLHHYSPNTLIRWGNGLTLFAGLLLLTFHTSGILTSWSLIIPSMIYFSCLPFSIANSASKAMTLLKRHYGAGSAILMTLQFLAGSLGIALFTLVDGTTALPLATCFIGVGSTSSLILWIACKSEKGTLSMNTEPRRAH